MGTAGLRGTSANIYNRQYLTKFNVVSCCLQFFMYQPCSTIDLACLNLNGWCGWRQLVGVKKQTDSLVGMASVKRIAFTST